MKGVARNIGLYADEPNIVKYVNASAQQPPGVVYVSMRVTSACRPSLCRITSAMSQFIMLIILN